MSALHHAKNDEPRSYRREREAYIKFAEIWLQSAFRSERFAKELIAAAEHEWVLPPFNNGVARAPHYEKLEFAQRLGVFDYGQAR